MSAIRLFGTMLCITLITAISSAQDSATSGSMSGMVGMPGMSDMSGGHDPEMHQAMQKMNRDMMGAPMTGDPDKDFATMMIPHHQGAVDMAKIYLKKGKDSKFRKLAESIIESQQKEIKEMKEHLSELEKSGSTSSK